MHTAGWEEDAGVFRIFDVWESREHAERVKNERLQPVLEQGPINRDNAARPDRDGFYELHDLVKG